MSDKNKIYDDMLPRRVSPKRCCFLDNDGFRCNKQGSIEMHYHGDEIQIHVPAKWVVVVMCDLHSGETNVERVNCKP